MRRYAPENTRWIPAFAGMTGQRNGANVEESPPSIPVYQGNDEKTMRVNKTSLNQTPANSRHSRESGNPVRCLRPEGPRISNGARASRPHRSLFGQDARAPVEMRRYAPESTRWIPAFAGMTDSFFASRRACRVRRG
jgi:hypothetical protein